MENLENQMVEEVSVEEVVTPVYGIQDVQEAEIISEEHSSSGLIWAVTGLIGLGTAGYFGWKKLRSNKKAKIQKEAEDKVYEILKAEGKEDEEIEEFINKLYDKKEGVTSKE